MSDTPSPPLHVNVSPARIRATVCMGRRQMRDLFLAWLPPDLRGTRVLDAGRSKALSLEVARRGAQVVAFDTSAAIAECASASEDLALRHFLGPRLGGFDYVVAMDSLIHHTAADIARMLGQLGKHTHARMLFTFAPRTPALLLMQATGRLFPRMRGASAAHPLNVREMCRLLSREENLHDWRPARTKRVVSGYYMSRALELVRS
jgi:magnesium-protoporphyrin O-methyltransferase